MRNLKKEEYNRYLKNGEIFKQAELNSIKAKLEEDKLKEDKIKENKIEETQKS